MSDEHIKENHASKGQINLGGFSVPITQEQHAFLVAQKDSEHFKVFKACIESYKMFTVNRLAMCHRDDLQLAQGQLQGLNTAISLLTMAASTPIPKETSEKPERSPRRPRV